MSILVVNLLGIVYSLRDQLKDRGAQINLSLETAKELQAGLIDTQGFQVLIFKFIMEISLTKQT